MLVLLFMVSEGFNETAIGCAVDVWVLVLVPFPGVVSVLPLLEIVLAINLKVVSVSVTSHDTSRGIAVSRFLPECLGGSAAPSARGVRVGGAVLPLPRRVARLA